jgi:hypothetical protein
LFSSFSVSLPFFFFGYSSVLLSLSSLSLFLSAFLSLLFWLLESKKHIYLPENTLKHIINLVKPHI